MKKNLQKTQLDFVLKNFSSPSPKASPSTRPPGAGDEPSVYKASRLFALLLFKKFFRPIPSPHLLRRVLSVRG